MTPCAMLVSFNSKLVRLKGIHRNSTAPLPKNFQFQTGAIKSILVDAFLPFTRIPFNSKLVRLKVQRDFVTEPKCIRLSIPNWCD